jgi:hypothetical protein
VIQVNFITGTPASPNTALAVGHLSGRGRAAEHRRHFSRRPAGPTLPVFSIGDQSFVAVAESLTKDVRFRTPSRIYRFGTE